MGLADLNQLIEHSIEEVSALFLERGAQPAPVLAQAIRAFSSKGAHHVVVVVGDPAIQRIAVDLEVALQANGVCSCLLYTSPSPRDRQKSRMPSSA